MTDERAKVVVGYDREVGGEEALALGCTLAHEHECDLLAVNVRRRVPGLKRPPVVDYMVAVEVAERVRAFDPELHVETRLVESGDPAEALGEVAAKASASMLVVGASRHHPPSHAYPGVTKRVVESIPCDVAIAPPGFRRSARGPDVDKLVVARPVRRGDEWNGAPHHDASPLIHAGATFPG